MRTSSEFLATRSLWLAGLLAAAAPAQALTYAIDFVATAAGGAVMDPSGTLVAGLANLAPSCTNCPPTFNVPSLWVNGQRHTLSLPANRAYIGLVGINAQGWVVGNAWSFDSTTATPTIWTVRADGSGVDRQDLAPLPGKASAEATGVDRTGRIVGVSNTWFTSPEEPFLWTAASGTVPLTSLGHGSEKPLGMSPGGTVGTASFTYTLGQPASTVSVSPSPAGWRRESILSLRINDRGDRAFGMLTTSSSPLYYLWRYQAEGLWQQIGFGGTGSMSSVGVGEIDAQGTVVGTQQSTGMRAEGPTGLLAPLAALLAPAYAGVTINSGNDLGDGGVVLVSANIGRAARVAKLVPVQACTSNCLRVGTLNVTGKIVYEPRKPGQCTARAKTTASAQIKVVDENGVAVRGAVVKGRFLDDYYLDGQVTLTTNSQGNVTAQHSGPACVGAIAFFVDSVTKAGRSMDRVNGVLTSFVIPQ